MPAAALFDRFRGGGRTFTAEPPTDEQWTEASAFIAELSPNRWQVYEQVIYHPHRGERAKWFLYGRYSELRSLQESNPERFEAARRQVKAEDEIFGLETQVRAAASPGDAERLRGDLRRKVADLVEAGLGERERRLKQLQDRLDREREELRADRGRVSELVDRRAELLREASDRFRAWASGDRRRFGRRPPPIDGADGSADAPAGAPSGTGPSPAAE